MRSIVGLCLVVLGCSDSEPCRTDYEAAQAAAAALSVECPRHARSLLDALDVATTTPTGRRASVERAMVADVTTDPVDVAAHDCNVRVLTLRDELGDVCR